VDGRRAHLPTQHGVQVLQPAMIGRRIRRENRAVHFGMVEPPMTASGLGGREALALKIAPDFLHLTACRQGTTP